MSTYLLYFNVMLESIHMLPRFLLILTAKILHSLRCAAISFWARPYSSLTRLCWDLNFIMYLETMRDGGNVSSEE